MNKFDAIILERLYERPCWAKTFYRVKPRLTALIASGYAERISPPDTPNTAQNMVAITPKGEARIERYWRSKQRGEDLVALAERMADSDEPPIVAGQNIGLTKLQAQVAFDKIILDIGLQAA